MTDLNPKSTWIGPDGHLTDDAFDELVDHPARLGSEQFLAAHLQGCTACSDRLRELQATVALFRAAPEIVPTRSFQLAPPPAAPAADFGLLARLSQWLQSGLVHWLPALRVATAGVLLLLVTVSAADLWTGDDEDPREAAPRAVVTTTVIEETVSATEQPRAALESVPQDAADDAEAAAPVAPTGAVLEESESGNDQAVTSAMTAQESTGEEADTTGAGGLPPGAQTADSAMFEPAAAIDEAGAVAATPEPTASPTSIPVSAADQEEGVPAQTSDDDFSIWRIIEFTLLGTLAVLVLAWLLAERLRRKPASGTSQSGGN
jgi:hypothetical protein